MRGPWPSLRHQSSSNDISRHLDGWPVTTESLQDTIRSATILVSTPSAAMLEAMALGTPVVYLKSGAEQSKESDKYDNPLGAYRIVETAEQLVAALREALTWTADYRQRALPFLSRHVELNPTGTMTEVAGRQLIRILGYRRDSGRAASR